MIACFKAASNCLRDTGGVVVVGNSGDVGGFGVGSGLMGSSMGSSCSLSKGVGPGAGRGSCRVGGLYWKVNPLKPVFRKG